MGNHPLHGGRTVIPAKIVTVSLRLLNPDGSLNVFMPYDPYEDLTLDSPNFAETNYTSGRHIQFSDAVQRAEFFNDMEDNWHTTLAPKIVDHVTLSVPRFVNVRFPDGSIKRVQAYIRGAAPNGEPIVFMLDLLFNALNTNTIVNEIVASRFTTESLNTAAYPNTYLFSIDNQGQLADCCVLGFHTYFYIPNATPQPRWIFQFASWMSPGVFSGGFADITPLSHETSESMNDPFIDNLTPVWQFPNVPPDALIPWFTQGSTSDAIGGAFSYPDTTALTHSALQCPRR